MAANSQVDSDSEQSTSESNLSGHRSSERLKLGAAVYRTKFNYTLLSVKSREIPISFCQTCSRNVSCEHQGRRDVEMYISKALHQSNAKSLKSQSLISFPRELSSSNTENVNGFLLGQIVILRRAMHLVGLKQPVSLMVQLPHHISKVLLNV